MGFTHRKIGPVTSELYQDHLGKLVATLSNRLASTALWEDFMMDHWGKSYLAPDINHIQHTAQGLLQDF